MSLVETLGITDSQLADFCRKWQVAELSLFGSALRGDLRPDSDVDVLVDFTPEAGRSLFDLVEMEAELRGILGREVDLVEKKAIEQSENYIRRRGILSAARVVYAAR